MEGFLELCTNARGKGHTCGFGEWQLGGFSIVIFVEFDDGVEWVIKAPKWVEKRDLRRLGAEAATLVYLSEIGIKEVPQLYDYSLSSDNPANTPYIIMSKMPGVPLGTSLHNGMPKKGMYKAMEGLAKIRQTLQKHPFSHIGSLYINDSTSKSYATARLISLWCADLDLEMYVPYHGCDPIAYYYAQHSLSLQWDPVYGEQGERVCKQLAHNYLGLLLPSYIIPNATSFYLAHADLSRSNVLVDPDDGTLLGVIDWEFANALPPQSAEHYPLFLADKSDFVEYFENIFEDPAAELENLRTHYAAQFHDAETSEFNGRIDTILSFENLLHSPNERTIEGIVEVMDRLRTTNAFISHPPHFPLLNANSTTRPTNDESHIQAFINGDQHSDCNDGEALAPAASYSKSNSKSISSPSHTDHSTNPCPSTNEIGKVGTVDPVFLCPGRIETDLNDTDEAKKGDGGNQCGVLKVFGADIQTESTKDADATSKPSKSFLHPEPTAEAKSEAHSESKNAGSTSFFQRWYQRSRWHRKPSKKRWRICQTVGTLSNLSCCACFGVKGAAVSQEKRKME